MRAWSLRLWLGLGAEGPGCAWGGAMVPRAGLGARAGEGAWQVERPVVEPQFIDADGVASMTVRAVYDGICLEMAMASPTACEQDRDGAGDGSAARAGPAARAGSAARAGPAARAGSAAGAGPARRRAALWRPEWRRRQARGARHRRALAPHAADVPRAEGCHRGGPLRRREPARVLRYDGPRGGEAFRARGSSRSAGAR